jgi:RHS repeat-associated protein
MIAWRRHLLSRYNPDGTVKEENLNNSTSATNYSYNDRGFLTSISNPAFGESIAYTGGYNNDSYYNGSIASDSYSYPGAPSSIYGYTYSYSYDQNNRMTNAGNSQNSGYSYTSIVYDANGNATDRWQGSTEYGFTYSGSNRPIAFVMNPHSQNPIIYPLQYDNDGNMTYNQYENRDLNVTYDPFTLMTQTMTEGSTQLDFEYDGRKERLLKTANGTMTLYLPGTNDYPLEQESGSATRFYVYGPTGLIAEVDGGVPYFVLKDHLGSTQVVLNNSNTPVSWYSYTPYGGLWQSATSEDVDYKFTGQEYDPETYLYNFRARIYDDALGIFYAYDPAGQDFSPYMYVNGNPVVFVDRNGRWFGIDDIFASLGGGLYNLVSNLLTGHIRTWGEAGGYFVTDAAAGEATLYGGPVAGGAVLGFGNSITSQVGANGWGGINWGQVGFSTLLGGGTAYAGNLVGSWVNSNITSTVLNSNLIASPVVNQAIGQAIGGGITGYTLGFLTGFVETGNLSAANASGISNAEFGTTFGLINGTVTGVKYAEENNLNLWTGQSNNTASSQNTISTDLNFSYHDRVENQTDPFHSYPRLFDKTIMQEGQWSQRIIDGANMFTLPGSITIGNPSLGYGTTYEGEYQIIMDSYGIIFHRFFSPNGGR